MAVDTWNPPMMDPDPGSEMGAGFYGSPPQFQLWQGGVSFDGNVEGKALEAQDISEGDEHVGRRSVIRLPNSNASTENQYSNQKSENAKKPACSC